MTGPPPPRLPGFPRLRANRLGFLVDGEAYYAALADVLGRARRSVFIVGWDLHTEVELRRDGDGPRTLGEVLLDAVRRNRRLKIHLVLWDYALIYLFERQPLPLFSFAWLSHPRIHLCHDGTAPAGASHHQKFVVLDDSLAFVGGIDLTLHRWDTREHQPNDPRRVDNGRPYGPFHDVQAAVTGEAAVALGQLARSRWQHATGRALPPAAGETDLWPRGIEVAVEGAEVALASSSVPFPEGMTAIERSFLETIDAARHCLYIENQYLTSAAVGRALEASLQRRTGPEIVLVLPRDASGWLEQGTMDVLRTRLLHCLQAADRHGRLSVFHPVVGSPTSPPTPVYVHAKVFVADDWLARVGSANLSNRSMGFDTECDLLVFGDANPAARTAIARFRDSLVAEHLGAEPEEVRRHLAATGSLVRTIDALRGRPRTLLLGVTMAPDWMLDALPDRTVVDPERPLELAQWIEEELPRTVRAGAEINLRVIALLAGLAATAICTFHVSGLERIVHALELLPEASAVLLVGYCVAAVVPIPATLLHVAAILIDGPVGGLAVAALGSGMNAALTFAAGRRLGRDTVRRWAGPNLNRVARRLAKRGARSVAVVRALPITPFSVEGLVAGACGVRWGDYALGTLLGALPNLLVTALAVSTLRHALEAQTVASAALAALVFASLGIIAVLLARRLNPRGSNP